MAFKKTELSTIALPEMPRHPVPAVFDDVTLAYHLGIKVKTFWWLIHQNNEFPSKCYSEIKIPKPSGGLRVLHNPNDRLKFVQKRLLTRFLNPIPATDAMAAYVIGRSVLQCATKHVGKPVKISLDIKNFFGNTRRQWVAQWLEEDLGYPGWVAYAIASLCCVPVAAGDGKSDPVYVLPQGAPTSGALANFVGDRRIDQPLLRLLEQAGHPFTYTRYSDNLEISFDDDLPPSVIDPLVLVLTQQIKQGGYRVNKKKTRIQRIRAKKQAMRVLGIVVNEKPNIPKPVYRRLRAAVHRYTIGHADRIEEPRLLGQLIYWNGVNPEKVGPLLEKFREATRN